MLDIEHAIENAISSVHDGRSYEDWYKEQKNWSLKNVKSDPKEIWQMANYIYYSDCWYHWTEPAPYTAEEITNILKNLDLSRGYDYHTIQAIIQIFKDEEVTHI